MLVCVPHSALHLEATFISTLSRLQNSSPREKLLWLILRLFTAVTICSHRKFRQWNHNNLNYFSNKWVNINFWSVCENSQNKELRGKWKKNGLLENFAVFFAFCIWNKVVKNGKIYGFLVINARLSWMILHSEVGYLFVDSHKNIRHFVARYTHFKHLKFLNDTFTLMIM